MKKKKYLNKYSRENNYKKFTTLTYITCFIMVLFTTIGYSAMNRAVNISGDIALRVAGDIRITGVSKSSSTNNALSTYANFSKNTLALGTSMPANSTITYSFRIKNSTSKIGLLTELVITGAKATANQSMSLEVASSSSLSLTSNNTIPASTETTYTLTLNNNTSSTITDQRLLTFTFNYFDTLESGSQFNKDIRTLVGDSNPTIDTENTSIKAIKVVNTLPNNVETIDVSASKNGWIKAYFDNGTIYLYTILPKIILNESSDNLFQNLTEVTEIDTKNFDTSNVTRMSRMFYNCSSLTSLDVSNFDTSNVTNMNGMFDYCSSLTSLDVSNFDTLNVTDMGWMFAECSSLTSLDVSNFNTSKVTYMGDMFACSSLTSLDVSNFDTSKVTDMSAMFADCYFLTSLDVSKFDTSNVIDMRSMFKGCSSLTSLDLSNFNTSNLTSMSYMFNGCKFLTSLDVSNFDTSKVTNMHDMFSGCSKLKTIYVSNKFNTSQVNSSRYMFYSCTSLVGGNGTTYNSSYIDKTYARIDSSSTPGYFTSKA